MSSFTSELIVTPIGGRKWRLKKSFSYHVGSRHSRQVIKVPKDFVTDFASTDILQLVAVIILLLSIVLSWLIPFWVMSIILLIALIAILITPYGKHGKAAVLHDYLYQTHLVSKAMADLIFLEAMEVARTAHWKSFLMYEGVHIFGGFSYWRKQRRSS